MRAVFIGPSLIDDPHVHAIFKNRMETMGNPIVIEGGPDQDSFQKIAEQMHSSENEFRAVSSVPIEPHEFCTDLFYNDKRISEEVLLDGKWITVRYFHDVILPAFRENLRKLKREDPNTVFFIDLGRSLTVLYLAYFCAIEGLNAAIAFHNPPEGEPFSVGGMSVYARFRGLLRRHLCSRAIKGANQVFVDHQNVVAALSGLFPKMTKEIFPDPVSDFSFPENDDFLSSGKSA